LWNGKMPRFLQTSLRSPRRSSRLRVCRARAIRLFHGTTGHGRLRLASPSLIRRCRSPIVSSGGLWDQCPHYNISRRCFVWEILYFNKSPRCPSVRR
jgi:hypothetical protein